MSDGREALKGRRETPSTQGPASALAGLETETVAPGVLSAQVSAEELVDVVRRLAQVDEARLADLFAVSSGADVRLILIYALDRSDQYLTLVAPVAGERYPALSDIEPAAFVEECETYEQYGIRPESGKPLNRVLLSPARRHFPMQHKQARRVESGEVRAPHVVQGEAFEFPFGPVRGAGAESLYFGLVTTGEEVLDLYIAQWHKHRGIESRLVGLGIERATFFVERMEGLSAVGNTMAFVHAAESLAGVEIPEPAACTRAIALELERLYNHAAALAALCQSTGLSVGQARMELVLEQLLRLNAAASGHRYLFNVVAPGGVRRSLDHDVIAARLPAICSELREVVGALRTTNSHLDRLEATGIVSADTARRFGIVGPVARASGQDIDCRRDHPRAPYERIDIAVPVQQSGDVLSRMDVMVAEASQSERVALELLESAGPGRVDVHIGDGSSLGWAESSRGESLAWLSTGADGSIRRVRLRPAAVRNWRVFDDAARSRNVFTDIPIIEASFWLTVAGFAR